MIGKIKNLFDKYISAGFPITKDEHQHFTKDEHQHFTKDEHQHFTKDEHQHFCYAKTNPMDLPINLSVQYARPYKQKVTTTYYLLLITYYLNKNPSVTS